jgi:transposase-like protein
MNLTDKIFHDDEAARVHLEAQRWPDGPYCPHCGEVDAISRLAGASTRPGMCICRSCRKKFSVTVGTIFERSHIGLAKWTLATRLMASSKKGISALQLERTLGVTYKTAWFMAHRIREAMRVPSPGALGGQGKVVEADETYVGGKEHNKHRSQRKYRLGHGSKEAVLTLVERNGEARSFHLANVTAKSIRPLVFKNASRKSHLMTDGARVYQYLGREFAAHDAVDHDGGEYVREGWRASRGCLASHCLRGRPRRTSIGRT